MKRASTLARLSTLYDLMERAQTLALAQARGLADAADTAFEEHLQSSRRGHGALRQAVITADAEQRHLLTTSQQSARLRLPQFEARQAKTALALSEAVETHRESRLERDRFAAVLSRAKTAAQIIDGRRTQAALDDRFSARRAWQQARDAEG